MELVAGRAEITVGTWMSDSDVLDGLLPVEKLDDEGTATGENVGT